jgi:pimeloyl-ACP methyl ester carboxylesterase
MAAIFLTVFSMFSPAADLRPKPLVPVAYQQVRPADPPRPDFDFLLASNDAPPAPQTPASARGSPQALALAGLPPYHPFRSEEAKASYLALYEQRARDWPVPCDGILAPGAFGETFVRVSGPADAPPLVLLHGISSNSLAWTPNIAAWSRRHRVYAVDHIQDGGRSVPTRPLQSLQDQMAWLDGLFDTLGLTRDLNLAGLSYGGWLAAQYALARPQRLRSLVLLAPAGTVLPLSAEWVARAVACAIPLRYFTRSFLRWLLRDLAERPAAMRPNFDDILEEATMTLRCVAPHTLVPPGVLSDAQWRELAVPALYLVGEHEKICPPLQALERLKSVAPGIRTHLVAGAGHDLTLVKAGEVNLAVLDFLAAIRPQR